MSSRKDQQKYSPELTQRDYQVMAAIHAFDGVLYLDQIHRWYFAQSSFDAARIRMSKLKKGDLLQIDKGAVWLQKNGAARLAEWFGESYENFIWRQSPKWNRLEHDVQLNEVRYLLSRAFEKHPDYQLFHWYGQDELRRLFSQKITFVNRSGKQQSKVVWWDGLASVTNGEYDFRYPLEFDNASEDHQTFARDKVMPSLQLMASEAYKKYFPSGSGRVLVVTVKGERWLDNMRSAVTTYGGGGYFLFTSTTKIFTDQMYENPSLLLSEPIWQLSHLPEYFSLMQYNTIDFQKYIGKTLDSSGIPKPRLL